MSVGGTVDLVLRVLIGLIPLGKFNKHGGIDDFENEKREVSLTDGQHGLLGSITLTQSTANEAVIGGLYHSRFPYHNSTSDTVSMVPVACLCNGDSVCGCRDDVDEDYISGLLAKGSEKGGISASVQVVDGREIVVVNGTLEEDSHVVVAEENGARKVEGRVSGGVCWRLLLLLVLLLCFEGRPLL